MKRTIYIIIGVIIVIIIAVALWLFFTRSQATTPGTGTTGTLPATGNQSLPASGGTPGTTNTGGTPASSNFVAGTKFGIISNEPVMAYFVDTQNNVTVLEPDGKIATIANGQPTFLSSAEIQNLIAGGFSYDGQKILVNFGDPGNPQTSIFDLATKSWTPLPVGIVSPVWSPSDYRVAYLSYNADGTESLATLDISKASNKPVTLLTVNIEDVALAWPNKNQIVFNGKAESIDNDSSLIFNLQTKTFTPAVYEESGLETLWSNTTSSVGLIFSSGVTGLRNNLSLLDPATGNAQPITFVTLPSKCDFNYETPTSTPGVASSTATQSSSPFLALYCAIPSDPGQLANAELPDTYDQRAVFTADNFYKMNTVNGDLQEIFSPAGSYDATSLRIFNNTLFFVNRYDQELYAISLGQ